MTEVKIAEAEPHDVQAIAGIAAEAFWREYGSREKPKKHSEARSRKDG